MEFFVDIFFLVLYLFVFFLKRLENGQAWCVTFFRFIQVDLIWVLCGGSGMEFGLEFCFFERNVGRQEECRGLGGVVVGGGAMDYGKWNRDGLMKPARGVGHRKCPTWAMLALVTFQGVCVDKEMYIFDSRPYLKSLFLKISLSKASTIIPFQVILPLKLMLDNNI